MAKLQFSRSDRIVLFSRRTWCLAVPTTAMERRNAAQEDSLIFFGQGGSDFAMADADAVSAEERIIKNYLGGEPGERGGVSRRRVVRRPLGGGGYQAQTIVFSERDGSSQGLSASEPLSELLQQLAASRKGSRTARESAPSLHSSLAAGLAAAEDASDRKRGDYAAAASPAQQMRACFVQELVLSALSQPVSALDQGPLDLAFPEQQSP